MCRFDVVIVFVYVMFYIFIKFAHLSKNSEREIVQRVSKQKPMTCFKYM